MTSSNELTFPKQRRQHGFYRIAAVSPKVVVADPAANAAETIQAMDAVVQQSDPDLILFPELGLSAYTCGDLFATQTLLDASLDALRTIVTHSHSCDAAIIVGLPLRVGTSVMNVAALVRGGVIRGLVPKTFLPNYREFYEARHFRAASATDPATVRIDRQDIPFGTDLLFQDGAATLGVEICEDLWVPVPPSSHAAIAGANVVVNLSASNELIGKAQWRRDLVVSQSGRLIAAYAYSSAGGGESTSDLVFGGHCLIAENGALIGESRRIGDTDDEDLPVQTQLIRDVDLQRLDHDRRVVGSFDDFQASLPRPYRTIDVAWAGSKKQSSSTTLLRTGKGNEKDATHSDQSDFNRLLRRVDPHPFVPDDLSKREERCGEILAIQTAGLVKRLQQLPADLPLTIGISGGLDSTLALLVAVSAVDQLKRDRKVIDAIIMPGFGTTQHTNDSATQLVEGLGVTSESIDIRPLALRTFLDIGHSPLGLAIDVSTKIDDLQSRLQKVDVNATDLKFENVQARLRTMLLMSRGFVLGTGDLSEQALGWSTYNGDHMSMYNVNASVPKTLVRYLVQYAADHRYRSSLHETLHRIADTPISPELLPPTEDGEIRQNTEASIGPYELHDFFLYHFVRGGCDVAKMCFMAEQTKFDLPHSAELIEATAKTFVRRFFQNQFKRNCVPDGPKIGSVSLSPRGDWRMPADASSAAFRD
ncbi:MAG TPA: NAD(+) synthase [Rhodopirellula baltica]|uniref:Glutamine-dependent NAD(+) synthetase n=1 Tax=Rhodopirellula baltica (strain DSM 10527 / NCIMB 13988 / SH1) TaxID=243090 RepID=Q7URG9_RHOBA|nr:NAD(+) synthase [Rhodopirellula baltica]CAD74369.1 glutamine-dependent NAD(+) synthetase [Rhodopirellula baltica SH 1]HBE61317.1 NAD(+) synthase [Rhodopirellula baltica]